MLQSSFTKQDLSNVQPMDNGFVNGVTQAYNQHHHLILRPDDVWIAILCQFNLYAGAHGEDLRSHFVAHEGQKHLTVWARGPGVPDFGDLAKQMTEQIQKKVVDPELKDWILPNFTTTTDNDTVVSAVVMMSTLKCYFTYECRTSCGIPSVTLEGEKSDWEKILARMEKLKGFGPEPAQWVKMLQPILSRFISAFDGNPDIEFWNRVCSYQGGSGFSYLSGWITAFCVWNHKGEWQATSYDRSPADFRGNRGTGGRCEIDGVGYPSIDTKNVPPGYCEVEVTLNDNGVISKCMMVSGHLACQVEGEMQDGLRPLPSWFMFMIEDWTKSLDRAIRDRPVRNSTE